MFNDNNNQYTGQLICRIIYHIDHFEIELNLLMMAIHIYIESVEIEKRSG